MRQIAVVVALALLLACDAFKASDFKKCSESAFCKRHRRDAQPSQYDVSSESVKVEGQNIVGTLIHRHNKRPLSFQLKPLGEGVRFTVREQAISAPHPLVEKPADWNDESDGVYVPPSMVQPVRQRFEATEALHIADEPAVQARAAHLTGPLVDDSGASFFSIKAGEPGITYEAQLYVTPFRLDVLDAEKKVVSVNTQGLFRFESFRLKDNDHWKLEEPDVTDENLWEEKWQSWTDTKPHGPSSVGADFTFWDATNVFGIPERATNFALKATKGEGVGDKEPYRLFNLDVNEFEVDVNLGLYGAIPFMFAHSPRRCSGLLWLNAADTFVDVMHTSEGRQAHWISETGVVDAFILLGPTPADVLRQYSGLTGRAPLPPLFALGYHQCRWNYRDEADVAAVEAGFDQHLIPMDVMWLDIEHTDRKKYFTWDKTDFPTPIEMQNKLALRGRKLVTINDPHIKKDDQFPLFKLGQDRGLFVKTARGDLFEGDCWPGKSSWLDYLNPEARDHWSAQYALDTYPGATRHLHTWNDMNEPSVFSGPEITMPRDALHHGGVEHRELHNMYGFLMTKATHAGHLAANPDQRPYILSRSFFAGSQRYVSIWTGDNTGTWTQLESTAPMLLSLAIAGFPFAGADVGGFFLNPSTELLVRWYEAAAYQPFYRGHAHIETKRREPWLFGDDATARIRDAIRARYQLLPYIYTLFQQSSEVGAPVMRPLLYHFYEDLTASAVEDSFMLGPHILVHPIVKEGQTEASIYLPRTNDGTVWYNLDTGMSAMGGTTVTVSAARIPVFYRGGSIIPKRMRARRSSAAMARDPYTLVVVPHNGPTKGDLYIDSGDGFAYREGKFLKAVFDYANGVLSSTSTAGTLQVSETIERVIVMGSSTAPTSVKLTTQGSTSDLPFTHDASRQELTIHHVTAIMGQDWSITIA